MPNEPEESEEEIEDDLSVDEAPIVAISNAGVDDQIGQYYILTRDNTLQRVVFMTSQTEEDRLSHGFSAQLR